MFHRGVGARFIFVTGTDTGIGKTVLTCLLVRHLRGAGVRVAALKPVCSGGRDDARAIRAALGGALTLDEINPWHFHAALAPLLAARREGRVLRRAEVLAHARGFQRTHDVVLIEGAGGLLSPLGEDFDCLDLIVRLRATPLVVCTNRLGAVNQARLVLAALPAERRRTARVILMPARKPDASYRSNASLLAGILGRNCVHSIPRMRAGRPQPEVGSRATFRRLLSQLMAA